jgi:hypothetical protein
MRTLIPICLSFCGGLADAAPSPGGSFVETTKSYRPADIGVVRSLDDRQRNAHAWRGERVNWQILLWSGDEAVRAESSVSDLTGEVGNLPAKQVRLDFLKFIHMNTRDRYATGSARKLCREIPHCCMKRLLNGTMRASWRQRRRPCWRSS